MTKNKTIQKFEESYDDGPAKRLKTGSVAADLVAYESLEIGTIPPVMSRALDNHVLGLTAWSPTVNARVTHTAAQLQAATKEQRTADALVVSDLLAKGPDSFSKLGTALDKVDLIAQAEEAHEYARRTANAVNAATKGQLLHLGQLVGSEYRSAFLDTLDKSWRTFVIISLTDETTLGELTRLEAVAADAREIIGRLLIWAEGCNRERGFAAEELKLIRDAIKGEDWNVLPSIERIEERKALDASNSPDAEAEEKARKTKAEAEAHNRKYATEAAQARRGLLRKNSDEDLVE